MSPDSPRPSDRPRLSPVGAAKLIESLLGPDDPETEAAEAHDGRWFAGYQLGKECGRGGSGVVYEARRAGSGAVVALKLLDARGEADRSGRTWRELEVLKLLRIPGVPRVLDWGENEGRAYIVTELIEGRTLDRVCAELSRERAIEIVARAADIVQGVHERGVIHRDLKPSNILVTPDDGAYVLDFGTASVLEGREETTLTWSAGQLGTPAFMAPEQAAVDGRATSRTDVYGLGASAVFALTGRTLFRQGESPIQTLREVASGLPRPVRELDPTIPAPLAAVLEKAVAPQRDHRYESAAAFARDLRRWLEGEPVEAVPAGRWRRLFRRMERHPVATTAALCAILLAATLGGTVLSTFAYMQWWWWRNSEPARITRIEDGEADVSSRAGRVVASLRLDAGTVAWARLADAPGGGKLLAVGVNPPDDLEQSSLRVFDLSDGMREMWTWRPDFPTWARTLYRDGPERLSAFDAHLVRVEDVFPDRDGDEIISVHTHDYYSQSCLTVHSTAGELLYLLWHDGYIYDFRRIAGTDVYVAAAVDSRGEWRDRPAHLPEGNAAVHPIVMFGLVPKIGAIHEVLVPGVAPRPSSVLWHARLGPEEHAAAYAIGKNRAWQLRDDEGPNGESAVRIEIDRCDPVTGAIEGSFSVIWSISPSGEIRAVPLSPLWQQRLERGPVAGDPRELHWTILTDEH